MDTTTSWHRYPSPKALGHGMIANVLEGNVLIQEKVDGSQFSFGSYSGVLKVRSRGQEVDLDQVQKIFTMAVDYVKELHEAGYLHEGWMYTGEAITKPKHNTLEYGRIPEHGIILFDIRTGQEKYLDPYEVAEEAKTLSLETVPLLFHGPGEALTQANLMEIMKRRSTLGGNFDIEGIVIKNYEQFCKDGTVQMAKIVSEKFKEKHQGAWKIKSPSKADILDAMQAGYRSEARWQKAIQHLQEAGTLAGEPKDIGPLIKEVQTDLRADSEEEIKKALWDWAWPEICRKSTIGLPQWYKNKLMEDSFNEDTPKTD